MRDRLLADRQLSDLRDEYTRSKNLSFSIITIYSFMTGVAVRLYLNRI